MGDADRFIRVKDVLDEGSGYRFDPKMIVSFPVEPPVWTHHSGTRTRIRDTEAKIDVSLTDDGGISVHGAFALVIEPGAQNDVTIRLRDSLEPAKAD